MNQPPTNPPNNGTPPSQGQPQGRAVAAPPHGSTAQPGGGDVIYAGIAKHSAALGGYLKWAGVSVLGGAIAIGLNMADIGLPGWALGLGWLIGLPGILWTYLVQISSKYKISLRRVETEHGVLAKRVDSLELWRVLDVEYTQSLVDRIFNNGRIRLISTDKTNPDLVIHGLPNHRALFEQLREAVQNARHTNRPMELVGGHEFADGVSEMM
ncbi:PH domain-containing protein [Enhygromyxa salina]|uniref:Bacterial membrane flanked domain protein n=1 Tax=Enhygromyxa salina TaxID=215803 RepID=A0A2S9YX24_9BACT|nr:PH domain-containing protein [Enhygromyxa salina]PRQ09627.1 Bacterial membrane flanked domain protein [Enhygromyxa salina]